MIKRKHSSPTILVTHLVAEEPNIGWLWSIELAAEDALRESRRRKGAKKIVEALRAARKAIAYAEKLKDANSVEARALAHAMAAVHLAWQAEVADRSAMINPGMKQGQGRQRENERRAESAEVQRKDWRAKADEIRRQNPRLSKAAIARLIDPVNWNRVRKHI